MANADSAAIHPTDDATIDAATLNRLIAGQDLERAEVEALFGRLMDGELSEVHKTALLVAMACKGESPSEIAGAAAAMRARYVAIPHQVADVVDTCGTGGDGSGTFNVSTAAALIAAAAGVPIAKHGNRSVSSRSGSADVLAELGVDLEQPPERLAQCLEQIGITFLFAPALHPAMREVMPVRKALGVRTLFNVLGPLTNPAGARRQVMGVYSLSLVEPIGQVLAELGADHAMVVHGDGLDEITTTGSTRVAEVCSGSVECYDVAPEDFGLTRARKHDLQGADPASNAETLRHLLSGKTDPPASASLADIVALNAAAALYVGGAAESLEAALGLSREVLESGAAWKKLEQLVAFGGRENG